LGSGLFSIKNVKFYPHRRALYRDFYHITQKGFEEIYIERGLKDEKHGLPCNITIVPEDNLPTENYHDLLIRFDKALSDLNPELLSTLRLIL